MYTGCFVACAATLSGCGGGASSTQPLPGQAAQSGAVVAGQVAQPFSVSFARTGALTKIGIASSLESGSPEHDIVLTSGAAACVPSGTAQQCSFNLTLPWGPQTLTVTTYGSTVARTQLQVGLSGSRIALATAAAATPIAQISLNLQETAFASNLAATTNLYVTARDASGNIIIGSYAQTISIADSDTSGATSLSATSVAASTDSPLTVSYNGNTSAGPSATFTATSAGVPTTAVQNAVLSFTAPQIMYVGNQTNVLEFSRATALGDNIPINRFALLGYVPFLAAPDGMGNLLVAVTPQGSPVTIAGLFNVLFFKVPASASGPTTPTPFGLQIPANQAPLDFGLDSSNNVYVLSGDSSESGNAAISVFAPGATTPSRIISGAATGLGSGFDNGIAVSGNGTVAVNQTQAGYAFLTSAPASILIFGPSQSGNVAPARTIAGAATGLKSFGIAAGMAYPAWFPDGSLAESNMDSNDATSILVFAPGAGGNATPARVISGGATGINTREAAFIQTGYVPGATFAQNGISVDNASRIYVSVYGSSVGLRSQIVRFDSTANGNVVPSAVLTGNLTGLAGPGRIFFADASITPNSELVGSVSGDFLNLAPNRGWNYSGTPNGTLSSTPSPPATITLYADPQPQGGDTILVALGGPAGASTAIGSGVTGAYMTVDKSASGYTATGYFSSSNFVGGPIPGGLLLVPPTLVRGQTWSPYAGLTATVIAIGEDKVGSGPCPNGTSSIGATVQYTFNTQNERITYVPGCGITHLVTDNGTQIVLQSIGSYPQAGQLAAAREPASLRLTETLRGLWRGMFTPWSR